MICPAAVGVLLISCFVTLCAALPQGIPSERKGPLQLAMNKMAIFNEEQCWRQGGQCVVRDQCPEGKLAELKGLCPDQQSNDVECCYSAARSAADSTRCEAMGGFCGPKDCGVKVQNVDDCPYSQTCCALVN